MKEEDWNSKLRNYMARRLQYMYRQWKGRKVRQRKIWKIKNREFMHVTGNKKRVVQFIERVASAAAQRALFRS
jgi:hypothetical protein